MAGLASAGAHQPSPSGQRRTNVQHVKWRTNGARQATLADPQAVLGEEDRDSRSRRRSRSSSPPLGEQWRALARENTTTKTSENKQDVPNNTPICWNNVTKPTSMSVRRRG